ncbi:hypothetical protein D5272_14250 [bacterium D16-76]|nr:hypothetical protein [bacterium D16-76]
MPFSEVKGAIESTLSRFQSELPDDSGGKRFKSELPDDLGERRFNSDLPDDSGQGGRFSAAEKATSELTAKPTEFTSLDSMKEDLGQTYGEIKENKPPNSPNIAKWFDNGGRIKIEEIDGKNVWTYTDAEGHSAQYIDGKIVFPPEAKHREIHDINIGEFSGDRNKDKQLYLEKLEEEYGLTDIPDGYALHHDTENGVMQLVKEDYHKKFTHAGGHSIYKGAE